MKMNSPFAMDRYVGAGFLLVLALGALALPARAQLNESRVLRDATGIYSGKTKGGQVVIDFSDPGFPDQSGTLLSEAGRARIPVKEGSVSTNANDPVLPGDDSAGVRGTGQQADVKRGGALVSVKFKGNTRFDGQETQGRWDGTISGNLSDKGAKWQAQTKGNATQNSPGVLFPFLRTVKGLIFSGQG